MYVVTAGHGAVIYRRSRYCTRSADLQFVDADSFGASVRAWAESLPAKGGAVPVLPLSDRLVESLHVARHTFAPRFELGIPPPEAAAVLLNKSHALRLARDAALDVPRWVDVSSDDDLPLVDTLTFPVAVRPQSWSTVGNVYFKVAVYRERQLLAQDLRVMLGRGARLVVQEYVDAPDEAVEFSILWRSRDGLVTAQCTGRKRRQASAQGSVMVWGETTHLPDVADAASRFLTRRALWASEGSNSSARPERCGSSSSIPDWRLYTSWPPGPASILWKWRTANSRWAKFLPPSRGSQRRLPGWVVPRSTALCRRGLTGGSSPRTGCASSERPIAPVPSGRGRTPYPD